MMERQAKGITWEDDLSIEISQCGGWKAGEGNCSARKCKCANARTCDVASDNRNFREIHGDASYGEVGSSYYWEER